MDKNEILEKTLGDGIVVLTKEARSASHSKQEIHSRIAESLRQIFKPLRRSRKNSSDESA